MKLKVKIVFIVFSSN